MGTQALQIFDATLGYNRQATTDDFTASGMLKSTGVAQTLVLRTDTAGVTKQGTLKVPDGCRELIVSGVSAAPGGGAGSPLSGHGGGGAGMGIIARSIRFAVVPGEVLSYQIGGAGQGGIKTTATVASVAAGTGLWTLPAGSVPPTAAQRVQLENSGGALPTGFSAGTQYFVVSPSGLTFKLSASEGGAAILPSVDGSGVQHISFSGAFGPVGAQPATRSLVQAGAETWIKRGPSSSNRYLLQLSPGYPGLSGSSTGAGNGGGNYSQTSAGGVAPGGNGSTSTQSPLEGVVFNGSTGAAGQISGTSNSGTTTNAFGVLLGQRGGSTGATGAGAGGPGAFAFSSRIFGWPEAQEAVGGTALSSVGYAGNTPGCSPGAGGAGGCGGKHGSAGEDGALTITLQVGDVSGIVVRNLCTARTISAELIGIHASELSPSDRTGFSWDLPNSRLLWTNAHYNAGQVRAKVSFKNTAAGTLPTPLAFNTDYWCIGADSTGLQLSTSMGGSPITLSGSSSATQVYLNWKHPVGYPYSVARTQDSNIRLAQIFPTNLATPTWTRADALVAAWMAAGAKGMWTMGSIPTWASSTAVNDAYSVAGGGSAPLNTGSRTVASGPYAGTYTGVYIDLWDMTLAIATRFNVTQAATLFGGTKPIKYLEPWNEPSFSGVAGGYWNGTATQLANLKRTVFLAWKSVDSSIVVTDCGWAPSGCAAGGDGSSGVVLLNTASDGGSATGAQWMEAGVFHPYSYTSVNQGEMIRTLTQRLRHAYKCSGRVDWETLPLIYSEGGPEKDRVVSGVSDALLLARTMIEFGAAGWLTVIPFHHWTTAYLGDMTSDEIIGYLTWMNSYMVGRPCTVDLMGDGRYRVVTPSATKFF